MIERLMMANSGRAGTRKEGKSCGEKQDLDPKYTTSPSSLKANQW
jgi:hypothetical protein